MTQKPTPSLRIFQSRPHAAMRLFCFPYSGGGAQIYKNWSDGLPDFVEVVAVQLPGRAGRFREPRYTSVAQALAPLTDEFQTVMNKPFALFGHSLGAALAFEMGVALQQRGRHPKLVVCSGMMGPRQPSKEPPIYHLPDAEFRQKVVEFNGTPKEVLEHEELMDLVLPILKSDFTMADTYTYQEGRLLDCPLAAFGGSQDPHTDQAGIEDWANYTRGPFCHRIFSGDHFFLHPGLAEEAVLAELALLLGQHQSRRAP